MKITDTLKRPLQDLRISVTDRCNFRCTYCMPKEIFGRDHIFLTREELLTFEEIVRLANIFVSLGVRKIRLTGGEPLLRKEIEVLINMLAQIPGLDIAMTTNGALLAEKAQMLKDAGLKRVTVSLDSVDDTTFKAMNDVNFPVQRVLDGIETAKQVGLTPIKVNMVVKRGVNDQDILSMARYFRETGDTVRFIEYMDVGTTNGWKLDDVVSAQEMLSIIHKEFALEPIAPDYFGEVSRRWRYQDDRAEIGIITSVTQPFCSHCTRARLSARGQLYTCLFGTKGYDLRTLLRDGSSDEAICAILKQHWGQRNDRYSEVRSEHTANLPKVEMSYIGG
ncbi:MAG: GTP 3',8-cyclase MoaA [Chloroflexi bacterium]|nr:GTP 3',8-cyclase MoaA [Chloroflexota bacterium]